MATLAAFLMTTVDGFHEGPNGAFDFWTVDNDEFEQFSVAQLDRASTLVFGRVTYEGMAEYWPTDDARSSSPDIAVLMNDMPKIVVSRTLTDVEWQPTTIVDDVAGLDALAAEPGEDLLVLGSSELVAALAQQRRLDELRIMVNPSRSAPAGRCSPRSLASSGCACATSTDSTRGTSCLRTTWRPGGPDDVARWKRPLLVAAVCQYGAARSVLDHLASAQRGRGPLAAHANIPSSSPTRRRRRTEVAASVTASGGSADRLHDDHVELIAESSATTDGELVDERVDVEHDRLAQVHAGGSRTARCAGAVRAAASTRPGRGVPRRARRPGARGTARSAVGQARRPRLDPRLLHNRDQALRQHLEHGGLIFKLLGLTLNMMDLWAVGWNADGRRHSNRGCRAELARDAPTRPISRTS